MHQRSMQMMKHFDDMYNKMMAKFESDFGIPNVFKDFGFGNNRKLFDFDACI
jgi:hypothetical protein